jgi:hypothetical protein
MNCERMGTAGRIPEASQEKIVTLFQKLRRKQAVAIKR